METYKYSNGFWCKFVVQNSTAWSNSIIMYQASVIDDAPDLAISLLSSNIHHSISGIFMKYYKMVILKKKPSSLGSNR